MYRHRTRLFEFLYTAKTTVDEMLGPNPYRKSFLLSPIAGGPGAATSIAATVFGAGASQTWTVPNGVTQVVDMYAWGSSGSAGAAGAVLGGGGGGGGSFCTAGPLTVVPGSVYSIGIGAGGGSTDTTVNNPSGTQFIRARGGSTPVLDAAGTGGVATTGIIKANGGAGFAATGLAGAGGGGGGGGGNNAAGSAGVNSAGGAGGGSTTLSTYGAGGAGGAGGAAGIAGSPGVAPGGGAGGSGSNNATVASGKDGLLVVFFTPPLYQQGISISQRQDLLLGNGTVQFVPGITYPVNIRDEDIGLSICEAWYAICGLSGQTFNVAEYSYLPDEVDPAF